MLHKIENKYKEKVEAMLLDILHLRNLIPEEISAYQARYRRHWDDGRFYTHILPELSVKAKVRFLVDGTVERTPDGKINIEKIKCEGNLVHFLAFCLQEGELHYSSKCNRRCTNYYVCSLRTPHGMLKKNGSNRIFIDVSEWRQYIERKYNILAPRFDPFPEDFRVPQAYDENIDEYEEDWSYSYQSFTDFLTDNEIEVTGGIVFAECFNTQT